MFKKIFMLALLASAMFATPVAMIEDIPFPACYPCGPGDPDTLNLASAMAAPPVSMNEDIPFPACYPCGPGDPDTWK